MILGWRRKQKTKKKTKTKKINTNRVTRRRGKKETIS